MKSLKNKLKSIQLREIMRHNNLLNFLQILFQLKNKNTNWKVKYTNYHK